MSRARWTRTCRYIIKTVGEDNLMVGSDYTHRDPSMELEFRKEVASPRRQGRHPAGGGAENSLRQSEDVLRALHESPSLIGTDDVAVDVDSESVYNLTEEDIK